MIHSYHALECAPGRGVVAVAEGALAEGVQRSDVPWIDLKDARPLLASFIFLASLGGLDGCRLQAGDVGLRLAGCLHRCLTIDVMLRKSGL